MLTGLNARPCPDYSAAAIMTLIKCPGCGHTVSSVASKCPQCGTVLSQFRFVQGEGGGLTECRRCFRKVLSGATTCPYCGISRPGRRPPYMVVALIAAFAVPALVLAVLRGRGPWATAALPVTPSATQEAASVAAAAPSRPPSDPAVPAAAKQPAGLTLPVDPGDSVSPGVSPGGTVPTLSKWIVDWANVREGRALGTRVVRVLRPGTSVQVADRQAGWWALYADGHLVGYVAGSLLADQPPESRPDDEGRP